MVTCLTLRTGVDFQSGTVGMIQYVVYNIPLRALYDCCESVVSQQPAPISGGRHCRWTSKMSSILGLMAVGICPKLESR